jgi:hypothetical protein
MFDHYGVGFSPLLFRPSVVACPPSFPAECAAVVKWSLRPARLVPVALTRMPSWRWRFASHMLSQLVNRKQLRSKQELNQTLVAES